MDKSKSRSLILCLSLLVILVTAGCSGFMHGYTSSDAEGKYLKVNPDSKNFGYQRLQYIIGFRGKTLENFIDEKGYPDYTYEYKEDGKDRIILYYLAQEKAFVFLEQNWRPSSIKVVEIRKFTDFEKSRFDL